MKGIVVAVLAGALFAVGLLVSGMTVPARVTGFLDVTGSWDPTLAFVIGSALLVHAPLYRLIRGRASPLFDVRFHVPVRGAIDLPLVAGAALFGIGWGLSGYCPGPALVSLGAGAQPTLVFVGAMLVGIIGTRALTRAA